jgi:hypothetical protein
MDTKIFFHEVNQAFGGALATESLSAAAKQSLAAFLEAHKNQLEPLKCEGLDLMGLSGLTGKLGEFTGTIIDVLEPKMMVAAVEEAGSLHPRLFSFFDPQADSDLHFDIMGHVRFVELTRVVVLVPTDNKQLAVDVWAKLSADKSLKMSADGIPVLVESFLPRETFPLGRQMQFKGLMHGCPPDLGADPASASPIQDGFEHREFYTGPAQLQLILLETSGDECTGSKGTSPSQAELDVVKKSLHDFLAALTQITGDSLVSKFILFVLASPKCRNSQQTELVHLNLNVYGISPALKDRIEVFLRQVGIPLCTQEVRKGTLSGRLVAEHNHEFEVLQLNKLFPGMHSPVLFDETRIEPTKLDEAETLNVMMLAELAQTQLMRVKYFDKNFVSFLFDNPLLILSHERSIFSPKVRIPLEGTSGAPAPTLPTPSESANWVRALETVRQWIPLMQLQEGEAEAIQKDFVDTRKDNRDFGSEDFSFLLVLARFVGAFAGETTLNFLNYGEAKRLMEEVRARAAKFKAKSN